MLPRTELPKFDERDWSQFDFTRWHLDGIKVDHAPAVIADLAQRLLVSEEWQHQFQAILPDVKEQVRAGLERELHDLIAERETAVKEFEARTRQIDQQQVAIREAIRRASAPPPVAADPNSFQLGVKVAAQDIGLAGLNVRLLAPSDPNTTAAQGATDADGNVVLSLDSAVIGQIGRAEAPLQVLSPSGKPLAMAPGVKAPRPGKTDTRVIALEDSPDIQMQKEIAIAARQERERRATSLNAKTGRLKEEHDLVVKDLEARMKEQQDLILSLD